MKRIAIVTGALTLTIAASSGAQVNTVGAGTEPTYRPGWVFTPTIGVSETYDDNIALSANIQPLNNNDLVSSVGKSNVTRWYWSVELSEFRASNL